MVKKMGNSTIHGLSSLRRLMSAQLSVKLGVRQAEAKGFGEMQKMNTTTHAGCTEISCHTLKSIMAPYECKPKDYAIQDIPMSTFTLPSQVILRVHAFTFTSVESRGITAQTKIIFKPTVSVDDSEPV